LTGAHRRLVFLAAQWSVSAGRPLTEAKDRPLRPPPRDRPRSAAAELADQGYAALRTLFRTFVRAAVASPSPIFSPEASTLSDPQPAPEVQAGRRAASSRVPGEFRGCGARRPRPGWRHRAKAAQLGGINSVPDGEALLLGEELSERVAVPAVRAAPAPWRFEIRSSIAPRRSWHCTSAPDLSGIAYHGATSFSI